MTVVIILLSILVVALGFSTWNLFRKLEKYEDAVEESDQMVIDVRAHLQAILVKITELDEKKMFQDDDEVGHLYKQISDTIKTIEEL